MIADMQGFLGFEYLEFVVEIRTPLSADLSPTNSSLHGESPSAFRRVMEILNKESLVQHILILLV